jgi:serine/threonine protein kinase
MTRAQTDVRIDGRRFPVLDRIRIGGRTLLIIERLGHFQRPTFRAVERGLTQEVRCLQKLSWSPTTASRLRLLSKVSRPHQNLPMIVDSHRQANDVFLVTNWIDGPTLSDYLRQCRSGREPWPSVLVVVNLLHGLAHGLRLLHERLGVVHGDLSPNNLVLCRHSKRLVPIDFGSAWNVERSARRDRGDGNTRAFTAPEMFIADSHVSFSADQFSTMAVGYLLLTGEVPYDGLGGRVAEAHRIGDAIIKFTPPSGQLRHRARLPLQLAEELDQVMQRGLSVEARDRFATTREWIDALNCLRRLLGGDNSDNTAVNSWLLRRVSQLGQLFGLD